LRRKTLYGIIGSILLVVVFFVCAVGSSWFTNGNIKTWFNSWGYGNPAEYDNQSNVIITEGGSHGATILCVEIPVTDFAAYNLDEEETESAFTLTLSVTPETAVVTNFTWSAEFVNSNSEWAQGKDINDYYIITPAENNRSAVAACKQAFGEQIRIRVEYDGDSTIFATKMADYVKKIVKYESINGQYQFQEDCGEFGPICTDGTVVYGVGTIQGNIDLTVGMTAHFELSDEAYNYLTSLETTAYSYLSQLYVVTSNGVRLSKTSKVCTYEYDADNECQDWVTEASVLYFFSGLHYNSAGYGYAQAAFKEMFKNVTENQLRLVINATYKYSDRYSKEVTIYSNWTTVPESNVKLVDGVTIGGGDLIH